MKPQIQGASQILFQPWMWLFWVLAIGVSAEFIPESTVQLWSFILINILIAQSINLLTGVAGQISLGHAAFLGLGAYSSALLMKVVFVPWPLAVCAGMLLSALFGWLLSFAAGRVKEFYLAMMTLGFGMIFYEMIREWTGMTGGVAGLSGIPSPSLKSLKIFGVYINPATYFQILLVVTAFVLWQLKNFLASTYGRAFFAIQASEIAAGSIGVARTGTKREAYTLSAAITGLAGGFYAHLVAYLGPESFSLDRSVEALVMAVIGGLGSIYGPVLGAVVFTYLPEKLQFFAEWQFIAYGFLLMFSFLIFPKGLAGLLLPQSRYINASSVKQANTEQGKFDSKANANANSSAGAHSAELEHLSKTRSRLLAIEGVSLSFLGLKALDTVSMSIAKGEIVGLIGPNGSGKSTLINIVSGIYKPDQGQVLFEEHKITGLKDHEVSRLGLMRTFQDPRLVPTFTVKENILLGAHRLYRQGRLQAALNLPSARSEEVMMLSRVHRVMQLTGLLELEDRPVRGLPYGDQRMTELARVLVAEPKVLLLDEPAAGLSESELQRLAKVLRSLKERAVAIILIEHHMDFLDDLVDRVHVLESGKTIYQGDMKNMYRNPAVIAAYLGKDQKSGVAHA